MGLDITTYKIVDHESDGYITIKLKYNFPEWAKNMSNKKIIEYLDWDKYEKETGIKINDYCQSCIVSDANGDRLVAQHKRGGKDIIINALDIPKTESIINVISVAEWGYQRKGLNQKFYDDWHKGISNRYVWSKKELLRYKKDYCEKEKKKEFQEQIIDTFVDGESVTEFDW